jgi:NodT family efflux transporter outer membrane factor (OMF) lipoprotein
MNARAFLAAALAAALGGCELAPHYKVPVVVTPVSYKEAASWTRGTPLDSYPRGDWWRMYGDPTLDRLEAEVETGNPTLAAAAAAFQRARALVGTAEAGLYPQLIAGGHIAEDRQSDRRPTRSPHQPNQYLDNAIDLQATYEIDFWHRIADSIRASRAAAQATAADLETERLSLHAELADDYMMLRGLDAETNLLQGTVAAYHAALELTQNRFAGKIASGMDVARATTQLATASAQLDDIRSRRAVIEHAIGLLAGQPPALFSLPPASGPVAVPEVSPGIPAALLQRRPDIASAERQMAAANAEIGVTRAAFYPNISLNAVLGLADTGFDLFTLRDSFWSLGPGVALPLFEGGLRHAELAAALAAWRITVAEYRGTVLDAFTEVEDQLSLLHWLGEEQTSEDAAVQASRQTLDMAMNLYREGASSYLEVVTAQTAELDAERAALALHTRRLQASVALIRALGGGWSRGDLPRLQEASRSTVPG